MNAFLSTLLIGSSLLISLFGHVAIAGTGNGKQHVSGWSADILSGVHPAGGVSAPVAGCKASEAGSPLATKTDAERRDDMLRALISKHQLTTGKVAAFNPARVLTPNCRQINHNEDS